MGQIGRADRARVTDWFLASSSSRTGVSLAIVPSINITRVTPVAEVCCTDIRRSIYLPRFESRKHRSMLEFQVNCFFSQVERAVDTIHLSSRSRDTAVAITTDLFVHISWATARDAAQKPTRLVDV